MMRRSIFILFLLAPTLLNAQPERSELAIRLVRNDRGRPMKGRLVEHTALRRILSTKRHEAWSVQMHFTVSPDYPYGAYEVGRHKQWSLVGERMKKGRKASVFRILDCTCTDQYLLIAQGEEVMRIDVPDPGPDRIELLQMISPIQIVFKHGRFALPELIR